MKLELNRIESPFVFDLSNGSAKCTIDASPTIGGKDKGIRPMELVAGGLAGCIAIDVLRILEKQKINTDLFKIAIEATRKDATPAPFEHIVLTVEVDEGIDKERLLKHVELVSEKYCSVSASLSEHIVVECKVK